MTLMWSHCDVTIWLILKLNHNARAAIPACFVDLYLDAFSFPSNLLFLNISWQGDLSSKQSPKLRGSPVANLTQTIRLWLSRTQDIFWKEIHKWEISIDLAFNWRKVTVCTNDDLSFLPYIHVTGLRSSLHWHHNGRNGFSNHQPHYCLPNCLFRCRSKETSKLRVTGLCAGNSPETGEYPAQMASKAENVSIWWHHHVLVGPCLESI